jgi:hypothetical protein
MKWVTRDHVHLDRVVCPWLIRRFIDPAAEFLFVPWGQEDSLPHDATPFAIPGAELGPHDEQGTTFEKMVRKYELGSPALQLMARVVTSGVHNALHRGKGDENDVPALEGIGLNAISEGIMLITDGDLDNLDKSMLIYDALYAFCQARIRMSEDPELAGKTFFQASRIMKDSIKAAMPG